MPSRRYDPRYPHAWPHLPSRPVKDLPEGAVLRDSRPSEVIRGTAKKPSLLRRILNWLRRRR